ncbi:MAG: type II secretion system protein GspD [Gammaproteobacteria bacterium]|nr:type II secretion system protein GspD [Gammaproteobacteria bacterium]
MLVINAAMAQQVNFDFEDANLRTVIQAVAEFSGRNFLVDPRVQGKVTVVAPTPLTEEQAYKVFQAVLEVNGFVTVEADGAIKIVPAEEGKIRNTNVFDETPGANNDDIQTRVLHLTYVNPERLVPILRPLVPAYGHMAADSESSSLIITDRAANIERLVSIVSRLDRPAETGEVEVIPLVHASAKEMSELLGRLYPTEAGILTVMDDARTNSLIVKTDVATRDEIKNIARELDMPAERTGDTNVIFLNNADAENLVEVLQNMVGSNANQGEGISSNTEIMADPDTNAIIVNATKSDFNTISQVIENLDVRRLQVYVEALIAEVSTEFAREFGIQFQTAEGLESDNTGFVGGSSFGVGTSIQDATLNPLGVGAGFSMGFIDGTITLPDGTEIVNLAGLARALDDQTNANILSTPNLLTMDNQEAEIVVGQNVPFVTGSFSQTNAGTAVQNPFQTIERRDVGLTLRIKPQITEGSAIKMEIFQEVSSVAPRNEARDIVTNTRSLQTTVVAEDNRMIVLGGLIQDDISQNRQKIPLLGDIPILGNLFSYRRNSREKTNLLIFLRPRIIRVSGDMDEPTRKKYEYLDELSAEQDMRQDDDTLPPLEEWDYIAPVGQPEDAATGGDSQ